MPPAEYTSLLHLIHSVDARHQDTCSLAPLWLFYPRTDGVVLHSLSIKFVRRFERFEGVGVCLKVCGAAFRFRLLVVFSKSPERGVLMPELLLSQVVPSVRLSSGVAGTGFFATWVAAAIKACSSTKAS